MSVRRLLFVVSLAGATWLAAGSIASAATSFDTTTALTIGPSIANVSEAVTFTATVTGTSGNPTGKVTFASGDIPFGSAPLVPVPGSGTASTATYVTSSFAAGTYAIVASYRSDDPFRFFASTSPPVTLTVSPVAIHDTRLTLTVEPAQIVPGQPARLTARVAPTDGSSAVPSGDVTFDDNGVLLGTARLDASGTAVLEAAGFIPGTHTITASYAGDSVDRSASSSITLQVPVAPGPVQTTITAAASPSRIVAGQSTTLTAHVVQTGTATSPPAGSVVTFTSGNGVFLGQAPLDAAGNASLAKAGWVTGEYVVTASYVGDASFLPASASFGLTVLPPRPGPTPTLTVAAPSLSTTYGAAVPALVPTYTGFVDGDTPSSLSAQAVCSTTAAPASPVRTYAVTCAGAVDPYYTIRYVDGSVSVTPAPLTVTADDVSLVAGQPVPALTATITGFVNGETRATSGVTGSPSCTTTATAASAPGTYPIVCTQGTLAATNYRFATFVAGTVTVAPAPSTCSSAWPKLPGALDQAVRKRRCEPLLSSPSPGSPASVVAGQELTIVYADETPLAAGPLAPVAVLSTGRLLPVTVRALPAATGYRSLLTVKLPASLGPGSYRIFLLVHDSDGDVDLWTWSVTVAAPPPAPCAHGGRSDHDDHDDDERDERRCDSRPSGRD